MMKFIFAQIKKDFLWDYSYKITFFSQFIGIFLTVLTFFFISKTFLFAEGSLLQNFENNYFGFAIVGISILDLISILMRSIATSIRNAQSFGYIDILMTSATRPEVFLLSTCLYPFLKGFLRILVYLTFLIFFSDLSISIYSLSIFFIVIIVSILPFIGVAFLSSAFVMYTKQTDPINSLINIIISIFAGVVYPVDVLPLWMQQFSNFIPLTFQLDIMRDILINNNFPYNIISELLLSTIYSICFLIICICISNLTITLSKKEGF